MLDRLNPSKTYFQKKVVGFFSFQLAEIRSTAGGLKQTAGAPGTRKRKTKSKRNTENMPKKKKDIGETIEEEPVNEFDVVQGTLGESIYEDFDDPQY